MKLLFISILSLLSIQVIAQFSHYTWVHDLKVRSSPSTSGDILEKLKEGEGISYLDDKSSKSLTVKLRGKSYTDYWWKIKTQSGQIGWVFGAALQEKAPMPKLYAWVNDLRVRDKAGFEGTTLSKLAEGTEVQFTGKRSREKASVKLRGAAYKDYWIKVRLEDGSKGWIYAAALKYNNDNYHESSIPKLKDLSSTSARKTWWNALSSEWKELFLFVEADATRDLHSLINLKAIDISNDDHCGAGPMHDIPFKNFKGLSQLVLLEQITATFTEFDNLVPLHHLKKLTYLEIRDCEYKSLKGIEQLTSLENLYVDIKTDEDLRRVSKLTQLKMLDIGLHKEVKDLSPLRHLTQLENLDITWIDNPNLVFDLNIIKEASNLNYLHIEDLNSKNLEALTKLKNLEFLKIHSTSTFNFKYLSNCSKLEYLSLNADNLSNFGALSQLDKLKFFSLISTKLNLNDLDYIPNLATLNLVISDLKNLNGIEKQKDLKTVYLDGSSGFSSIKPLLKLSKLETLHIPHEFHPDNGTQLEGYQQIENKRIEIGYGHEVCGC
ncbi:MAG: SH3 domain-containing protein [Saprospiraceae bacterium]|nr:SH3 domain-containing protein [Saprospiraceae bacterium]